MIRIAILLLALAAPAFAGEPRTFKALNLSGAAAVAFKYLDGDTFDSCNLQQPVAHTPIGGTARGLVLTRCNLMNCDVPKDAIVEKCLVTHVRTVTVSILGATVVAVETAAVSLAEAKAAGPFDADVRAMVAQGFRPVSDTISHLLRGGRAHRGDS